jgi:hypothetical protein
MNKNLLIGGGVLAVAILGGVVLLSGNKQQNNPQNIEGAGQERNVAQDNSNSDYSGKTLKDLMEGKLGENVKCEFSNVVGEDNRVDGITYVSGKKVRVDYKLQNPVNGQSDLHMVSDGEFGYVWGDSFLGGVMQGMKFSVNSEISEEQPNSVEDPQSLDYSTPIIDCKAWVPDNGLFNIPENITFVSTEEMQQSATQSLQNASGMTNCSVCDSMPEAQKTTCRQSMNCEE